MAVVFSFRAKGGGEILMADPVVLRVANTGKKFCRTLRRSMYYGMTDVFRGMMGLYSRSDSLRQDEFWALDHVTFSLKRGEKIGLIGGNGSGKSTLLRLLAGIYQPDAGRIEVRGKVCALIALGAGFHPLLTGRENIYLNGTILGMTKREINGHFDQIVEFAGVGEFLDAPVKTYSSGMHVRLGFAIAIHSNPDLLLVDEVLAVGDAAFQNKCFEKVSSLNEKGAAIIFVSHSMAAVERVCTTGLLLKNGKQLFLGNVRESVQRYFDDITQENCARGTTPELLGLGEVLFSDVQVYQDGGNPSDQNIEYGKDFVIQFEYKFLKERNHNNQVRVWIRTVDGRDVQRLLFQECPFGDGSTYPNVKILPLKQSGTVQIKVLNPRLFPQTFRVDVAVVPIDKGIHLGGLANAALFNIVHPRVAGHYLEYGNMTITEFDYAVALS
jgi:ABC-type polysaccharide/polyol phosphate transport system ATPase subunit